MRPLRPVPENRNRIVGWLAAMSLAAATALLPSQLARGAEFVPLGFLPNGNFASTANAVSDQGPYAVVGFANTQQQSRVAFRWTQASGMQSIGSVSSEAADVSADGTVVVGADSSGGAWRWTLAGGTKTPIGPGSASALSDDGSVAVGQNGDRGWRWTQATGQVTIPLLPGATTNYNPAAGINADGRYVVGQGRAASGFRAYRYDAVTNTIAALASGGGTNPTDSARGITPDGQIVAGSATGKMGRWVNGVLVNAEGNGSYPGWAITDDGATIVGRNVGSEQAYIWDAAHGIRDLKAALSADHNLGPAMTGWTLSAANDISGDGSAIVGFGINPDGFTEAFLVIIPEPATPLVAAAFLLVAARRPKRPRSPTLGK